MKKFLSFFKTEKSKALEVRADFRLGSDLPEFTSDRDIYVRADFLNLAGFSDIDENYMSTLVEFCSHVRAKKVHATFAAFEHKGIYFFRPIPPILSPNLVTKSIDRLQRIQQRMGLPLAIRNIFDPQMNLATFMPQGDFYFELTSRSGAHFICDVSSTVAFAKTFGEDPNKHLQRLLEIDNCSAFVQGLDELKLVQDLKFAGPIMGYEDYAQVICEGEFE